jgi:hypothetical protein
MSIEAASSTDSEIEQAGGPVFVLEEDVRVIGEELGMTATAVEGMLALDPRLAVHTRNWDDPEARARFGSWMNATGEQVAAADEGVRAIMRDAWNKSHQPAVVSAVSAIANTQSLQYLRSSPEIARDTARGIGQYGSGRVFEANVRLTEDMAELGVLQALQESDTLSKTTILYYWYRKDICAKTTDADLDRYCERREQLTALLRSPGFEKVIASGFGKHIMYSYVNGFLSDTGYKFDQWQSATLDFLELATDDKTFQHLEAIGANNTELFRTLIPRPGERMPIAEYRRQLADLAAAKPDAILPQMLGVSWHLSDAERLRFIHTANYLQLQPLLTHPSTRRRFHGGAMDWILDESIGSLEDKKELLADQAFVKGLLNASSQAYERRLHRKAWDDVIELVIDDCMEPTQAGAAKSALTLGFRDHSPDKQATLLFTAFYKKFGLDCYDLLGSWDEVGQSMEDRCALVRENLGAMRELEKEVPGICRSLRDEFFIRHFGRYDPVDMVDQYLNKDEQGSHGIALYASKDGNTALRSHARYVLPRFRRALLGDQSKGDKKHLLRVYEASTPREVAIVLSRSRRRYGRASIGLAAVHGYMDGESILWGDSTDAMMDSGDIVGTIGNRYHTYASNERGLGAVFLPDAPVIAHSCSMGKETKERISIGRAAAVAMGVLMLTSTENSSANTITVDSSGPQLRATVTYTKKDSLTARQAIYDGRAIRRGENPHEHFEFAGNATQ